MTAHNTLVFTLDDPERALARVGLDCDDAISGSRRFRRTATGWTLTIPQPDLNRVEYRLVVTSRGGDTTVICDPDNTERVATAFGDRSVALLPGYESPGWLTTDAEPGTYTDLTHHDTAIGDLPVTVWS
ncbi:MAG: hypothetical protein ACRDQA_11660, partial [Nocardioidaceae bacterium]